MTRHTKTNHAQKAAVNIVTDHYEHQKANEKREDIIKFLADSYENRRARQIYKWELIRKQTRGVYLS